MRMIHLKNAWRLPVLLFFAALQAVVAAHAADSDPILVGRIAHIEGKLLRYIEEEKDWVLTVKDAPFGLEDTLYADDNAKAELILPNSTWIRVGGDTQIELIALHEDATTVDVASGLARFYNRSLDGVVKVTTPFGYVVALGSAVFDLYVGDESLEVVAVSGVVDFVHGKTGDKYEVREGGSSLIADNRETALGSGTVDQRWDDWNEDRDRIWTKRLETSRQSAAYLPAPLQDDSYALEENGRWERVYYEGSYRDLWRPTRVDPGWRPFTAGRWVVYYGDNCWVPDEPFGYVTHHYGSWIYVDSFHSWYWAPPVPRPVVDAPSVFIGFGWYPGRVGWFHSGETIGWVPLAPHEVYYGHRYWGGRRTVLVDNSVNININIGSYRYLDEAVVVRRDYFYGATRYTPHIDRGINRTVIVNNYQPTTIINNTIINNYNTDRRRFAIHEGEVVRKPHFSSMQRIEANQALRRDYDGQRGGSIRQELNRIISTAQPVQRAEARPVTLTSRMVEATKVSQPLQEANRVTREIKPRDRERRVDQELRKTMDNTLFQKQGALPVRADKEQTPRSPREIETPRQQHGPVGPSRSTDAAQEQRGRAEQPQDGGRIPDQEGKRHIRSPRDIEAQQQRQTDPAGVQGREDDRHGPRNVEDRRHQREGEPDLPQGVEQDRTQKMQRQHQEVERQQQEEGRRRQQEAEQRKQQDLQRQQQEEGRRRQQEAEQFKQQDIQRQQQEEGRRRQQEAEQFKQQDLQRQQQEEGRRRQQEAEQRKQQDIQRQQQEEGRRRQQEAEQRKQQDIQRQQQEEGRRRQQESEQFKQQDLQQQSTPGPRKKTKKQLEEEELLKQQQQQQQQQQPQQQSHGRNK